MWCCDRVKNSSWTRGFWQGGLQLALVAGLLACAAPRLPPPPTKPPPPAAAVRKPPPPVAVRQAPPRPRATTPAPAPAPRASTPAPATRPALAPPASAATNSAVPAGRLDYRMGVGDLVRIQVHGEDDLTLQTRLDDKGTVTFAFLGEVRAVGLTVRQLESWIANGLRNGGYLVSPEVQVLVLEYRPFYINGEVKRPGGYPYVPGLTAQKAVTVGGGFTPLASENKIFVIREQNTAGTRERITLDSAIFPGDTVVVEEGLF